MVYTVRIIFVTEYGRNDTQYGSYFQRHGRYCYDCTDHIVYIVLHCTDDIQCFADDNIFDRKYFVKTNEKK